MKVTLTYPPNRNVPSSPFGALPLLAGTQTETGHEHGIVDVNLEVFEHLLRRETVDEMERQYRAAWEGLRAKPTLTRGELEILQGLARQTAVPFDRLREAEHAGAVLRDPVLFREPENVNRAYETIANLLRTVYLLNPVYYPESPGALDAFYGHLESDYVNLVSRIVDDVVIDKVLAQNPDLVAVSIPFNEQLLEAFAFLKQLKARAPEIRTVVGGAIMTAYSDKFCRDPRFYRYADLGMPGEADQSFPELVNTLDRGGDLDGVANLWWRDGSGEIHAPTRRELPDLDETAPPDWSEVDVGRYFLPDTIVNYQTSRGCYYGKCVFCSDQLKKNFRHRRADLVARDVERVQEQTGLRHFIFWDPLTPPALMKDIASWNKDRGDRKIWWGAETKFEKMFARRETMELLREGGARFLQFGYESSSQRMLDRMQKGNDMTLVPKILDTLREARIAVSVQWFIGFPGESEKEANESFGFLHRHRDGVLLSSYMGTFTLSPDDEFFPRAGDLFDIDIFQAESGYFDYRGKDGTPHYDFEELHAAYMARGDMESVTRMAFFLYLTDQPERAHEVTNFDRGGLFPSSWDDLRAERPSLPDANYVATYDFDVVTPPAELGIPEEGAPLPAKETSVLFVTQSQTVHSLTPFDVEIVRRADGRRTAAEIVEGLDGDAVEAREKLLGFVRRGLLSVPLPQGTPRSRLTNVA